VADHALVDKVVPVVVLPMEQCGHGHQEGDGVVNAQCAQALDELDG
jgi:hypothetical protein